MILFLDETGLRLIPFIGKTWAKKGRENTPVFKHYGHWTKVSIEAHYLPPYAFELMPVEGFNGQLKVHELKNAAYRDTVDLHARVRRKARRIQRDRALCRSFWGQTPLRP